MRVRLIRLRCDERTQSPQRAEFAGDPDSGKPAEAAAGPSGVPQRIAPLWHTAVLVIAILLMSVGGINRQHLVTTSRARVLQYLLTLSLGVAVVRLLRLGRAQIGNRAAGARGRAMARDRRRADRSLDGGRLLGHGDGRAGARGAPAASSGGNRLEEVRRQFGYLVPRSTREVVLWMLLSMTAGICEEIIFRGYLQRQLAALTGNVWAGIAVSGLIFGCRARLRRRGPHDAGGNLRNHVRFAGAFPPEPSSGNDRSRFPRRNHGSWLFDFF